MIRTVHLIDDDPAILLSLSALLRTVGWLTQTYDSPHDFHQSVGEWQELTGCLLLDIRMPGKTGLTLLEEWRRQGLEIPVIIMTGHGNIDLCRRAFKNGAFEFLTKPVDADLLFEVVGSALEQQEKMQERRQTQRLIESRLATLTAREQDILRQVIQGGSSKEIARTLSLSPRTVEAHRASIFTKLSVNSVPKLMKTYGGFLLSKPH